MITSGKQSWSTNTTGWKRTTQCRVARHAEDAGKRIHKDTLCALSCGIPSPCEFLTFGRRFALPARRLVTAPRYQRLTSSGGKSAVTEHDLDPCEDNPMSHLFISSHTFKAFLCAAALTVIAVASPLQGQTKKLYLPLLDASDTSDLGLAFVNPTLNEAQVTLVARTYNGAIITGSGITNPVTLTLSASSQKALRTVEIFGSKINGLTGWVEFSASMPAVRGFFLVLDHDSTFIGGTELITTAASRLIFPKVSSVAVSPTQLTLVNTSSEPIHTLITLYRDSGQSVVSKIIDLPAFSGFTRSVTDLVPSVVGFEGYAIVDSAVGSDSEGPETLIGIETYRKTSDIALIRALPEAAQLRTGYLAHLASQGGYSTTLTLI